MLKATSTRKVSATTKILMLSLPAKADNVQFEDMGLIFKSKVIALQHYYLEWDTSVTDSISMLYAHLIFISLLTASLK